MSSIDKIELENNKEGKMNNKFLNNLQSIFLQTYNNKGLSLWENINFL
jgi:hypothetical protein